MSEQWIFPDWPAPRRVRAITSTRRGGFSKSPYDELNLGDHVGDDPDTVAANRGILTERLRLPAEPVWLAQVHGCSVADAGVDVSGCEADAIIADEPGKVCAVLTADCLPVLLCDREGTRVAAVHAGWRGLAGGVIEAALDRMGMPGHRVIAWLGPAIGPRAFAVGGEVRRAFLDRNPRSVSAFVEAGPERWLADLYALARYCLADRGVGFVGGGGYCTVSDARRFYSYRRDGVTGRMASLIWIAQD